METTGYQPSRKRGLVSFQAALPVFFDQTGALSGIIAAIRERR
jgi:hypothetical protein